MVKKVLCLTVSILFLFTIPGHSLDPYKRVNQYVHRTWTTDHGLPQNSIVGILQGKDGYLWIATQGGLSRFDGVKFTNFTSLNIDAFSSNLLTALAEDKEGNLWVGTRDGLIVKYPDNMFKRFSPVDGLIHPWIRSIMVDDDGNVWIGTRGKGLNVFENGALSVFKPEKEGIVPENVSSMVKADDLFLLGTVNGLIEFRDGAFAKYTANPQLTDTYIYTVHRTHTGVTWISTKEKLYFINDGILAKTFHYKENMSLSMVSALAMDKHGNHWFGTDGEGFARLNFQHSLQYVTQEGMSHNTFYCITEDHEGNLWAGSYNGLHCFSDGKFVTYTEKDGLANNITWTVYEDPLKQLWITTNNGLSRFKDGSFTNYGIEEGLSSKLVSSTMSGPVGQLWIGTYNDGVNILQNGKFRKFQKEKGTDFKPVRTIIRGKGGVMWIGTELGGIAKISNGNVSTITEADGLSSNKVIVLYEDEAGNLWAGTDGMGLNRINAADGSITVFRIKDGLASDVVFSITGDREGFVWIGTEEKGINCFKDGRFSTISIRSGLRDNSIYQMVEDNHGFFWIAGGKGVSRVSKQELQDFVTGKIHRVNGTLYGKSDGMLSNECNGSFQPAGWKGSSGKIWFPTLKGVVAVDPGNFPVNRVPPAVVIETVIIDGKRTPYMPYITIPPDVAKIELEYTALSFSAPEKIRFQYKLEGFDPEWVKPFDRKDRIATYTTLPPGNYTFTVAACNNDGIWNETGASFTMKVESPLWQKWWFILLSGILFAIISYYAIAYLKRFMAFFSFWKKKSTVGEYRIIDLIGSGGMANIYSAVHRKNSKAGPVALKLMKEEYSLDPAQRTRFLHEGMIVDSINHPNIVEILHRGESGDHLYIVMELLKGQTLAKRIESERIEQESRMDIGSILDIMIQVTGALLRIHEAGIIHRDLKPENIMLVQKGKLKDIVKILDFGLAKTQALPKITETGMVLGTICYLAPEQLYNSEYSTASDIYALGVIFFEMVTGERPYSGETALEIMQEILKANPVSAKAIRPELPGPIDYLITTMMANEPETRPTAESLAVILEKLLEQENE